MDEVKCGGCGHAAHHHRERVERSYGEKHVYCDEIVTREPWVMCDCEKQKAEVVYDHFDKRLKSLEGNARERSWPI